MKKLEEEKKAIRNELKSQEQKYNQIISTLQNQLNEFQESSKREVFNSGFKHNLETQKSHITPNYQFSTEFFKKTPDKSDTYRKTAVTHRNFKINNSYDELINSDEKYNN